MGWHRLYVTVLLRSVDVFRQRCLASVVQRGRMGTGDGESVELLSTKDRQESSLSRIIEFWVIEDLRRFSLFDRVICLAYDGVCDSGGECSFDCRCRSAMSRTGFYRNAWETGDLYWSLRPWSSRSRGT